MIDNLLVAYITHSVAIYFSRAAIISTFYKQQYRGLKFLMILLCGRIGYTLPLALMPSFLHSFCRAGRFRDDSDPGRLSMIDS